jgi:serine/threonine-protein phosphatase 6 regulatory subunit 3
LHLVFRFPFIACEIFTCEIDVILKTLVEEEEVGFIFFIALCFNLEVVAVNALLLMVIFTSLLFQLMNLLFSFLEPNRSHSALLAGYFSKVCFQNFVSSFHEKLYL